MWGRHCYEYTDHHSLYPFTDNLWLCMVDQEATWLCRMEDGALIETDPRDQRGSRFCQAEKGLLENGEIQSIG